MRSRFTLVALALAVGCSDASPVAIAGSWTLTRVNAAILPAVIIQNAASGITTSITAGELTIRADLCTVPSANGFTLVTVMHDRTGANDAISANNTTTTVTGTVERTGNTLRFTATGGETWQHTATLTGRTLSLSVRDRTMEYAHQ